MAKSITHTDDSVNAVYFAQANPGWNGYNMDQRTRNAIDRAQELGRIEINTYGQFRLAGSSGAQNQTIFHAANYAQPY